MLNAVKNFQQKKIQNVIINIEKESTNILYYNVKKRREKIEENIFYKIRKLKTNAQK